MHATTNLKDYRAVLTYTEENGRKLKKTKLFDDIKKGRLKKQPDGTFRQRDVDRYMASLPMAGTPDAVAEKAADRQRRKEEADIRKAEAAAEARTFDLAVKKGRYVLKDQVHLELAARAGTLSSGLLIFQIFTKQCLAKIWKINNFSRQSSGNYRRCLPEGQHRKP